MNYDRLLGGIDREVPPIPGYISKQELKDGIDAINALIPEEATPENQLATKGTIPNSYTKNEADSKFVASTSVRAIVTMTQAEYDLITTPDANTLYCIIEP